MINKFNLLKVYRLREYVDARKQLNQNTDIGEDRKSGIITIVVTDKVPYLGRRRRWPGNMWPSSTAW